MDEFCGWVSADGFAFGSVPAAHALGSRRVLYRGYIANRGALAAEARRRGAATTADPTDAELFALAYEWWDAELARHVLGEFALALFDGERRRLVLAHDELGLMPLFYGLAAGGLAFASHLDDLVRETGVRELDEDFLADYVARGDHFGARTPYAHLKRLLPGESAAWSSGAAARRSVWTLDRVEPLVLRDAREYEERLRDVLAEAVTSATPDAGSRVWCELSGGLDSSTVAAFANRRRAGALEAVSFIYSQSYTADERRWIEIALRHVPLPWHPIDVDMVRPFTEFPARFAGEPNGWIASAALDRAYTALLADHGVDVVLTGEGGDAVLLGDEQEPFYLADLLLRRRWLRMWDESRRWSAASRDRRAPTYWILRAALRPALRRLRSEPLEYRAVPIPWAAEGFAGRTKLIDRARNGWLPPAGSVGAAYVLQRVMRSANVIATHNHHRHLRCEMRDPLMYRPLLELMLAIPWPRKIAPEQDRVLQRRALHGVLAPETLRRGDKGGGDQPACDGLASSRAWFETLTARPRIVEHGYARLEPWRDAVRQARVGRTIGLKLFQASATLEVWLQQLEGVRGDERGSIAALARPV